MDSIKILNFLKFVIDDVITSYLPSLQRHKHFVVPRRIIFFADDRSVSCIFSHDI